MSEKGEPNFLVEAKSPGQQEGKSRRHARLRRKGPDDGKKTHNKLLP